VTTSDTHEIDAELRQALARAACAAFSLDASELPEVEIAQPRESGHGDLASNLAMQLARHLKRPPREIAAALAERLELDRARIERVEVAGPGFLNFHLAAGWTQAQVGSILLADADFGRSQAGGGERVQVEFVSANPTGPLNVVSARAAAVGDTLIKLLAAAGYAPQAEFYVNDAGNQAELFAASLEARWRQSRGEPAEIPEGGYHGDYVREIAATVAGREQLEGLDDAARLELWREQGLALNIAAQRADLERFGVVFDRWFHESELHAAGALEAAREVLTGRGAVHLRDGATWFASSAYGDDEDRVIVRSDGRPTYLLGDIAYHADKHGRGFERVIDILGPDHHGHVARMQAVARALGYGDDWLEILIVQQVNLLRGGKPVKMSKRAGEIITLAELVEEVGRDPARFFFLMRRSGAHLDFDLDVAKQENEENPCYYVQYAHARICSIIEHAVARGQTPREAAEIDFAQLVEEPELALIKQLAALPEVVAAAAAAREPHRLTGYLREVAAHFHRFYHHHRVVGVEEEVSQARLALARATRIVLRNGLTLLGISAPERM
jgi:arginyl-tRNA synthetase